MSVIKLLVLRQLSTPLEDLNSCWDFTMLQFYIAQQTEYIWKVTVISFLSMDEET